MPREVLDSAERTLAQLEGASSPRIYGLPSAGIKPVPEAAPSGEESSGPVSPGIAPAAPSRVAIVREPDVSSSEEEAPAPGFQLSLFQLDDPTLSAIRDELKAADLDNMTPMQAFDLLRSMKAELGL